MQTCELRTSAVALAALLLPVGLAWAQSGAEEAAPPLDESVPDVYFDVSAGYEVRFETDIDGGGEFDMNRFAVSAALRSDLSSETRLHLRGSFQFDDYEFDNASGLVDPDAFSSLEPWDDVYTFRIGLMLEHRLTTDWTVFGGPTLKISAEDDADLEDSIDGGAFIGARYQVDEHLALGGGFGLITELEDDVRFSPLIIVNWQLSDELRLTTEGGARGAFAGTSVGGLELVYGYHENWEVAIGASYEYRRFRLDDDGIAPDGVAQDESIPAWVRLSYKPSPQFRLDAWLGSAFAGEFRLEDSGGGLISERDYDPGPMLGISGRIRF